MLANHGTVVDDARGEFDPNIILIDDIKNISKNKNTKLYQFSFDTAHMYRQKYKGNQIIHTGHSLGAVAAILVAPVNGEQAVEFDSLGVQGIIDNAPEIQQTIKKEAEVTLYQSTPNPVNSSGKHFFGAKIVPIKHGESIEKKLVEMEKELSKSAYFQKYGFSNPSITNVVLNSRDFINIYKYTLESHSLENIIKSIEKYSIEKYTILSGDSLSSIAKNRYGLANQ